MTAPAPRKVGELASIQHLRGLAALSVAAYHALQWRGGGFDVGRAGVDVFFVISGVVMFTSTVGRGLSPLAFLRRRAIRVVPPYWIATLVTAATAWLFPAFLPQVLRGTSHLLLSLAFIPHFDPMGRPFPTLPAGWSLDYEAMFYLAFAAALMTPESGRARLISVAMLVAVAIGLLAKDPVYQLGANPMLFQFVVGVWLGVAVARRALPSRTAGVAMIVAAFALWGLVEGAGLFKEFWRPFQWGAPAALLVGGALSIERHGGWPRLPWLTRLGDASYSLYLWHPAAIAAVAHVVGEQSPAFFPLALAAAVAAGLASYAVIERPILAALRARPRSAASS